MKPPRWIGTATAFLLALSVEAGPHPLTIEDVWGVRRVGSISAAPDGNRVVIDLTVPNLKENSVESDLWILDSSGAPPRQLTGHPSREGDARWSPDGRWITFTAKREGDEANQVYLISPDGGEARRLTTVATGVSALRWFPDSRRVAFISWVWPDLKTAPENATRLKQRADSKVKAFAVEDLEYRYWDHWFPDGRVAHIHAVVVETGETQDLMAGSPLSLWRRELSPGLSAGLYDIAPDGKEFAFVSDTSPAAGIKSNRDILAWSIPDGRVTNLTPDNPASDDQPRYSPDGQSLAWLRAVKPGFYADRNRIAIRDRRTGSIRILTEDWDRSPLNLEWTSDSRRLFFGAEERAREPLWVLPASGGTPRMAVGGGTVGEFALMPEGRAVVFARSSFNKVPEVFLQSDGSPSALQLEAFNLKQTQDWALGNVVETNFPGWNGKAVQSWVVYPPDFDPTRKWPLIQMVHGGPHGAWLDQFSFRWNPQVMAAQGYVVVGVNFHGSTGFGQEYVEASLKHYGEKELADVEGATDALIRTGYIDADRLTAAGGSFGGYMMAWLNGHTDRYKAHVCHALVYDWPAMMASDFPSTLNVTLGAYPWEDPGLLDRQSPLSYAKNFKTPTLVVHGNLDYRVPDTQGLQYYNTLKVLGVPARLLYYPNENHWILAPQDSVLWYQEFFAWLGKYAPGGGR